MAISVMATVVILRCSECFHKFRHSGPWPSACPNCLVPMAGPKDDAPEIPAFLSIKTRRADQVYRDMEKGSEFRVQKASEMLGVPTHELSHMKNTDLKDAKHPGDVAVKLPPPVMAPVINHMAAQGAPVGFMNGPQMMGGVGSEEVSSGSYPNMGTNFIDQVLRPQHLQEVDARQYGRVQSENPALETQMPAYRSRQWRR